MIHPQAYHTSCRVGLSGRPGFQFNAASRSLDRDGLAALAAAHTGYAAPRDQPLEPSVEERRAFPVALKVSTVPGVGTVASRTTYVGREFRGRDGAPDEGRFGNYFSHVVVGAGAEPFGGLLGVELWDAPHWRDEEADGLELDELPPLRPGPLDLEHVLTTLAGAPPGVAVTLLDAAMAAIDGGPRVVVVEPDPERRTAWIGWLSFALPESLARRLSFTTFDGRPRYAADTHVCMTTPACDTDFAAHELGQSVALIDATRPAPDGERELYARAATALAERGPDVLADAVRAVAAEPAATRGAALAVTGEVPAVVGAADVPAVVAMLVALTEAGQVGRAAITARDLVAPAPGDAEAIAAWGRLHGAARRSSAGDAARDLASIALERIIPAASSLPEEVPALGAGAPTTPMVASVAPWLSAVEAVSGEAQSGPLIAAGLRLGLLRVNAAVDRRVTSAIVAGVHHADVRTALDRLASDPELDPLLVAVTEALADEAERDRASQPRLSAVTRYRASIAALQARAERTATFAAHATWLRAVVEDDPSKRRPAARRLAELAAGERDQADIRELWGPAGPTADDEHADLLGAWCDAGFRPPTADVRSALARLMVKSLRRATTAHPVGHVLARLGPRAFDNPAYAAWWCAAHAPGPEVGLWDWAQTAQTALTARADDVPEERFRELVAVVARVLAGRHKDGDYDAALARLRQSAGPGHLDPALARAVAAAIDSAPDPVRAIAELFVVWTRIPGDGPELLDAALPDAIKGFRRRDSDIAETLPAVMRPAWEGWVERHPRTGVGATVGRAFGRVRGRDRPAEA